MKNITIIKESVAGLFMLFFLFLFINPMQWNIASDMFNVFAVSSFLVFFLFAFFICHRKENDERDEYVLLIGERAGFITACAVLLAGLIYQAKTGTVDEWMAITFILMVIAKILGMIYAKLKY